MYLSQGSNWEGEGIGLAEWAQFGRKKKYSQLYLQLSQELMWRDAGV